jgi:O-antigen/teichoic acid export membrane protein
VRARRLSVRALWGLASWALPLAVVFAVTPALLRALGPERFGVLMIILVTPLLASQFEFGITSSAVRRIAAMLAAGKVDAGRTLVTLEVALGVIGFLLGAAVWIAAASLGQSLGFAQTLGEPASTELVRWCAVWIAVTMALALPGLLARSAQALGLITAVQTIGAIFLWLSALLLARSGRPLADIVAVGIFLSLMSAATVTFATRRHVDWRGPLRVDPAVLSTDVSFSAGMFASQIAGALVYQFDRILVSAVGSPAIAGAYALCANLANKTLAAVVALTSFAYPYAAGLHAQGDAARLAGLLHALDRAVIAIVSPILLPGLLLAGPFLSLWLGEYGTSELATVFRILWLGFAINAFSVPIGSVLAAHGIAGLAARFAWLTALIVVSAILLLVPLWGARGAAFAMFLGMATSPAFNFVARKALALPSAPGRGRFWFGILCGLAVQMLLLIAARPLVSGWTALLLAGAAAVAVFYLVRAIFGLLSPEEERLLTQIAARRRRAQIP